MSNLTSVQAGEALVKGRVVTPAGIYADDATENGMFITFESAASGEMVTVYAGGSAQVPVEADASITAGDALRVTDDGKVEPAASPVNDTRLLGFAETSASAGEMVYITFSPSLV